MTDVAFRQEVQILRWLVDFRKVYCPVSRLVLPVVR